MIKSRYSERIIQLGLKYGKYDSSKLFVESTNKIRNVIYSYIPRYQIPRVFCYENNNKPKENFYRLTLPRVVQDDKILILQSIKEYKKVDNFFNKFVMNPLIFMFGTSLVFSIYNINSVLIMLSLISGVYSMLKANTFVANHNIIVDSIFIKSCGRKAILNTLTRKKEVDIMKIRKMRMSEYYLYHKFFQNLEEEFIPLIIDYEVFLIPKCSDFIDKEILFALSHSCYIENN